jgi:hypothetical protein
VANARWLGDSIARGDTNLKDIDDLRSISLCACVLKEWHRSWKDLDLTSLEDFDPSQALKATNVYTEGLALADLCDKCRRQAQHEIRLSRPTDMGRNIDGPI